jgi:ribosomal protein S18 acetylase RimI-like enzyme
MAKVLRSGWQIQRLSSDHDRSAFRCGKPSLDEFLQQFASQYDRRDIGRTYVAVTPPATKVLGYYTLASGAVAFATVPPKVSRKLPRHPVPVAHLGRLAVGQTCRGQGLGETLLLDALKRCAQLAEELGIFAVEVYALDDAARGFYLKYGFTSLEDDQHHLYLPMKTVRRLNL